MEGQLGKVMALCCAAVLGLVAAAPLSAQDVANADANNPLANVTAFNIQNHYSNGYTSLPNDVVGNQFVLRYAKPISIGDTNWLLRASLPFNNLPVCGGAPKGRDNVSIGAFQPFWLFQFQDGWFTGGASIWTYDFNSDNYNVPFGLRLGKVHKFNNTAANLFLEPQWSLASRGDGQADFQLYSAINLQFK